MSNFTFTYNPSGPDLPLRSFGGPLWAWPDGSRWGGFITIKPQNMMDLLGVTGCHVHHRFGANKDLSNNANPSAPSMLVKATSPPPTPPQIYGGEVLYSILGAKLVTAVNPGNPNVIAPPWMYLQPGESIGAWPFINAGTNNLTFTLGAWVNWSQQANDGDLFGMRHKYYGTTLPSAGANYDDYGRTIEARVGWKALVPAHFDGVTHQYIPEQPGYLIVAMRQYDDPKGATPKEQGWSYWHLSDVITNGTNLSNGLHWFMANFWYAQSGGHWWAYCDVYIDDRWVFRGQSDLTATAFTLPFDTTAGDPKTVNTSPYKYGILAATNSETPNGTNNWGTCIAKPWWTIEVDEVIVASWQPPQKASKQPWWYGTGMYHTFGTGSPTYSVTENTGRPTGADLDVLSMSDGITLGRFPVRSAADDIILYSPVVDHGGAVDSAIRQAGITYENLIGGAQLFVSVRAADYDFAPDDTIVPWSSWTEITASYSTDGASPPYNVFSVAPDGGFGGFVQIRIKVMPATGYRVSVPIIYRVYISVDLIQRTLAFNALPGTWSSFGVLPGSWNINAPRYTPTFVGNWTIEGGFSSLPGTWTRVLLGSHGDLPGTWANPCQAALPGTWDIVGKTALSGEWILRLEGAGGLLPGLFRVLPDASLSDLTGEWRVLVGPTVTDLTGSWTIESPAVSTLLGDWTAPDAVVNILPGLWVFRREGTSDLPGEWAFRYATLWGDLTVLVPTTVGLRGEWRVPADVPGPITNLHANVPEATWTTINLITFEWDEVVISRTPLDGYYWWIDTLPSSSPDTAWHRITDTNVTVDFASDTYGARKWYFHVAARNTAGFWGTAGHFALWYNHEPYWRDMVMTINGMDTILSRPVVPCYPTTPHLLAWSQAYDDDSAETLTYDVEIATWYTFDINPHNGRPSIVRSYTGLSSRNLTLQPMLSFGTYFWRIQASDGKQYGPWSSVGSFVVNQPPKAPTGLHVYQT